MHSGWAAWSAIGALAIVALAGIACLPRDDHGSGAAADAATEDATSVGTTGAPHEPLTRGDEGQRVEFEVAGERVADQVAFWVGEGRERVLVVLPRDTRDGAARQRGLPATHAVEIAPDADRVRIVGTVARLPRAEARFSWNLSRPEHAELMDRGFLVLAEEVVPLSFERPVTDPHRGPAVTAGARDQGKSLRREDGESADAAADRFESEPRGSSGTAAGADLDRGTGAPSPDASRGAPR